MKVPRRSTLRLLVTLLASTAASCAFAAACTTGVTPACDDAGTCLVSQPPDGSVVGEGSTTDTGMDSAPEARPEAAAESGADVAPEAAGEAGMDGTGGAGG